jgi:hypothetical protein
MSDDYSPAYEDFVLRVNRFMDVVSAAEHLPTSEFLRRAGQAIADLYSGALDLPDVEPETNTNVAKSGGGSIYTSLRDKLGPFDDYWKVFDSSEKDDPVHGSLADDISDIHHDLTKGLRLAEHNASPSEVIWLWRLLFQSHWGAHAVGAMCAIYWRLRPYWLELSKHGNTASDSRSGG